ncbi:MAG TPA: hypothetical protein VFC82_11950 [Actinomycetaceae bacterium]|nr:hypothetical protein [Actinomycetaceae bacterium]
MPLWLTLIVVGVVLALIGVFVEAAKFLIWLGLIVLVVSIIMSIVTGRRGSRV